MCNKALELSERDFAFSRVKIKVIRWQGDWVTRWLGDKVKGRHEFVQNFTPPDFQAKNFKPSISPKKQFKWFKKKIVKMEKFTPLAKILHCHRYWRHGQIPPLDPGSITTSSQIGRHRCHNNQQPINPGQRTFFLRTGNQAKQRSQEYWGCSRLGLSRTWQTKFVVTSSL